MVAAIGRVQVGTDKTAAELAMARLKNEIAEEKGHWELLEPFLEKHAKSHPENLKREGTSKEEVLASIVRAREAHRSRIYRLESEYEEHRAIVTGKPVIVPPPPPPTNQSPAPTFVEHGGCGELLPAILSLMALTAAAFLAGRLL